VPPVPPATTAHGALVRHITEADPRHFQPMNVNYGLFPEIPGRIKKAERRRLMAERALQDLEAWRMQLSPDAAPAPDDER
jgi:methylenetetrahydrofolate--tRNA-(uracil-5-)-methyltransferase